MAICRLVAYMNNLYAAKAGLTDRQIASLAFDETDHACWSDGDRVLIRLCERLHRQSPRGRRTVRRIRIRKVSESVLHVTPSR